MSFLYNDPDHLPIRRLLRRQQTRPEYILWQYLQNRKLCGLKFKRQYGVGRYIVDFYCSELRLAIEVDGESHASIRAQEYDAERTSFLNAQDIHVVRLTNDDIILNMEGVYDYLERLVRDLRD